MSVTRHNIAGFPPPPPGFSHVTAARGNTTVHISGQTGSDESGTVVPGGLAAQTERAAERRGSSMLEDLARGGAAAREQRPFPDAAVTLLGVAGLFVPDMLIEIEAVAVFDA